MPPLGHALYAGDMKACTKPILRRSMYKLLFRINVSDFVGYVFVLFSMHRGRSQNTGRNLSFASCDGEVFLGVTLPINYGNFD